MTLCEIERFAEEVAQLRAFDNFENNLSELIESFDGRIVLLPCNRAAELEDAALNILGVEAFEILTSPAAASAVGNMAIAREFGHYLLHTGSPCGSTVIDTRRNVASLPREQADHFAQALLMPQPIFADVAAQMKKDINSLAGWFRVSTQAVGLRLKMLGLA